MENNIAVGILVGIAVATSIFVWKSVYFTKNQKLFLIALVIFPPLQWLLIFIIIIYNKSLQNQTTESNLNNAAESLAKLNQKGILSDEEYDIKIKEVKKNILKKSPEYIQLKNLLDSNILTQDEFQNKLALIKKDIKLNKIPKVSFGKDNAEKSEDSSNKVNIFFFICVVIVTIALYMIYNNNQKTNTTTPIMIPTPETTDIQYSNETSVTKNKKFVYTKITLSVPEFIVVRLDLNYNFSYSVRWKDIVFLSDVIEVQDYNEDEKYKLLDQVERRLSLKIDSYNINYRLSVMNDCKDEYRQKEFLENKTQIKDRQVLTFDSYSEASIQRQNENTDNLE